MSGRMRIIGLAAAALIGMWAAWSLFVGPFFADRSALLDRRGELREVLARCEQGIDDHRQVRTAIASFVNRTLGPDLETVDHRLRTRLNRLCETAGLKQEDVSVTTPRASSRPSPARAIFPRAMRDGIDFVEVTGRVSCECTLEQALELLHRIEGEPWLHQISRVHLTPRDNGDRFNVSLDVTTLFLPGRSPEPHDWPTATPTGFARFASLAQANPFRVPPPPAAPPVQPAPQPTLAAQVHAPPPFPWERWRVTGIARGPNGVEVWLLNGEANESRTLAIGESLEDAELIAASDDAAEFRLGNDHFKIMVGKTFADRDPVNH